MKNVLILGSGGREHALAWKIAQSPLCGKLFVAPGNGGTEAWNVALALDDFPAMIAFAQKETIDLTVVGPEDPLAAGIADAFRAAGLRIFGPSRAAARLEGSKAFAKKVMAAAGVPTARCGVFTDKEQALAYVRKMGAPIVVKADGLAAGKGVVVAADLEEALKAVAEIMGGGFGSAGEKVVIEECLNGSEVSLLCLCDGEKALPMVAVQDHKQLYDQDQGPNTGGMGTYSPPVFWAKALEEEVMATVVRPTLSYMKEQGTPFSGVLFLGLMITDQGPKVLEYNVRFGDPETQVVMTLLESDLLPVLDACAAGHLEEADLRWRQESAVCVVMAAPGYPGAYPKGIEISLPDQISAEQMIFQAGTTWSQGVLVSSGGRVLGVTARGQSLGEAREKAYGLVEQVSFPGAHYRRDISLRK